jgi:hypothetical protein
MCFGEEPQGSQAMTSAEIVQKLRKVEEENRRADHIVGDALETFFGYPSTDRPQGPVLENHDLPPRALRQKKLDAASATGT